MKLSPVLFLSPTTPPVKMLVLIIFLGRKWTTEAVGRDVYHPLPSYKWVNQTILCYRRSYTSQITYCFQRISLGLHQRKFYCKYTTPVWFSLLWLFCMFGQPGQSWTKVCFMRLTVWRPNYPVTISGLFLPYNTIFVRKSSNHNWSFFRWELAKILVI